MAGTLKLTDIAHSSGAGTITVDSLATLAISTGKLTVGGTAIETGAQGVISKTATYPIVAGDFTGKSSLIVFVDVSSGTGTEAVITLPTPAVSSTCAIQVVSKAVHGLGNKVTIKNSAGTEIYTLYHVMDHCEFVSDGTTTMRTGNEWVTVRGDVALTTNLGLASTAVVDLWDHAGAGYAEVEDIGSCWSTSTDDFTAPFAGEFMFAGSLTGTAYSTGYGLKKNGTYINAIDQTGIMYGNSMFGLKPFVVAKNDVITWWCSENASTTHTLDGNASASSQRCTGDWWCLRRY